MRSLEELAATLDADPEFHLRSQAEQDQIFAELAKDIPQSSMQPTASPSTAQPIASFGHLDTIGAPPAPTLRTFAPASVGLQQASSQHPIIANLPFMRAGAAGLDVLRNVGSAINTPLETARTMNEGGGFHPIQSYLRELGGGRIEPTKEQQGMKNLTNLAVGMIPFGGPVGQVTAKVESAIPESLAFLRPVAKKFRTLSDIRALPEKELAKLSTIERQAYVSARNLEDQQFIAQERQVIQQKYKDVIAKVRQDQQTLGQAAPAIAHERLKGLAEPFDKLRKAQSVAYENGVKEALASAPEGDVFFTKDEINQALAQQYLQPSFPGQPTALQEDPTQYRQMIDLLHNHDIVNKNEISARDLLNMADKEFSAVSPAAKGGAKSYTPSEVAHAKLRDVLLNLLDSRGIDVRSVKANWAEWVPVRNLGFRLQSPSGPSQIIRIVKGLDPIRAEHLDQLEALIGQSLRGEVRGVFNQLDALNQQKIIEGAKLLESQRLLNQNIGFMKGSRIEQKLRLDQMAQHYENVTRLILAAAKGAAGAVGASAVGGTLYGAYKLLHQ